MRILPVGADALLLELDDDVEAWWRDLWQRRERGEFDAREIVAGARTVLLDGCQDATQLSALLAGWAPRSSATAEPGPLVEIPIEYDGEDLEWVADYLGRTASELMEAHLATEFHVAFCGFAPGFAYMTGFGTTIPRLDTPRSRVPAGAVGLADTYCGIYPTPSPGGWRLIGRTTAVLFDPGRAAPALLRPGTRVRFIRTRS